MRTQVGPFGAHLCARTGPWPFRATALYTGRARRALPVELRPMAVVRGPGPRRGPGPTQVSGASPRLPVYVGCSPKGCSPYTAAGPKAQRPYTKWAVPEGHRPLTGPSARRALGPYTAGLRSSPAVYRERWAAGPRKRKLFVQNGLITHMCKGIAESFY